MDFETLYTIRPMSSGDMRQVVAIEDACEPNAWSADQFHESLQNPAVEAFVAARDDEVLGFIVGRRDAASADILNLAVAPKHRRKGIGSDLMEHVVDRAHRLGAQRVALEVRETNLEAQLFYRQNGFKASAIRRRHYDDTGEDAYVMERALVEGTTLPWRGIIH